MQEIEKLIQGLKKGNQSILTHIEKFLRKENLSNKKKNELLNVGKFLTLLKGNNKLLEERESPDFVISHNLNKVGLEIEKIPILEKVESIKRTTALFNESAELFAKKYPDIKILADIYLNNDNPVFKKCKKDNLKLKIVEYIKSLATKESIVKKPWFIKQIDINKSKTVKFFYNPGPFYTEYLDEEHIIKAVCNKESKISSYKQNTKLDSQWLLLVIGELSPDSYEFGDYPCPVDLNTNFERVYLMEFVNSKLFRIK